MNIITKLEVGKRNKERVNIYIDNEYALSVSAEIIYKQQLKVKDKIDYNKIKNLGEEDDLIRCKNTSLKIVERSHKTEKEIRDKLKLKEYNSITIENTIKFLKEYNFINDYNYTKMYIRDKLKTQGERKIRYSLISKGIDESIIDEIIDGIEDIDSKNIAYELARKKYRVIIKRETDKYKISQKLYAFLVGRGYSYNIVSDIVKEVISENNLEG